MLRVTKSKAGKQEEYHYTYDALGRRINKTTPEQSIDFVWNGDVLLSEKISNTNGQECQLKIYLYEPDSFKPLAIIQNNKIYHYHLDHLGTPQELTHHNGELAWSVRYKAYGNVVRKEVEAIENNLRFQGQYYDIETGLHYNRHRYYDPTTARFISLDPIGLLGGYNNYEYAKNPIAWIDPLGLTCKERYNRYKQYREQGFSPEDATKLSKTKPDYYVGSNGSTIIAPEGPPGAQSPWPVGLEPSTATILQPGTKMNMAMSKGQPATRPGGFATFNEIPNRKFVRDDLGVIRTFKKKNSLERVEEYEVIKPLKVKSGKVGPQIEVDTGEFRSGGAHQIEMLVSPKDRTKYIQPTGNIKYFDKDDPDV